MFGLNYSTLYRISRLALVVRFSIASLVAEFFLYPMVLLHWPVKIKLCFTTWQQPSAFWTTWWFCLCFTPHSEHLSYKNKLRAISVVSHYWFNPPFRWLSPTHTVIHRGKGFEQMLEWGLCGNSALNVIYTIHLSVIIMILNSFPAFKRLRHFRRAWLFVIVCVLFSTKTLYIVSKRCNVSLLLSKKSISI